MEKKIQTKSNTKLRLSELYEVQAFLQNCATQPTFYISNASLRFIAVLGTSVKCVSSDDQKDLFSTIGVHDGSSFTVQVHGDRLAAVLAHFNAKVCKDRESRCSACSNPGPNLLPLSDCREVRDSGLGLGVSYCTNCYLCSFGFGLGGGGGGGGPTSATGTWRIFYFASNAKTTA